MTLLLHFVILGLSSLLNFNDVPPLAYVRYGAGPDSIKWWVDVDKDKFRYESERHEWNTTTLKALKIFRPIVNKDIFIKITSLVIPTSHITDPMLLIDNEKLKAERLEEYKLFFSGILA